MGNKMQRAMRVGKAEGARDILGVGQRMSKWMWQCERKNEEWK